ncbi:hypothetical protein AeNC1_019698 [Aphanomyces euteiches]|nr:hypothetical protein AeNC1_019698 [Aphanomyces euteiches]
MQDLLADEENESRRTFCQMPFDAIYENAEKGGRSVANLLDFIAKKNIAERKCAETMLQHLQDIGGYRELSELEEPGTSTKRVLTELQHYFQTMNTQYLVWAQVVEEHVARPLDSLKGESSKYIQNLQVELSRVNDEYNEAEAQQRKAKSVCDAAKQDLLSAQVRQEDALHEIGVPSFELQRLASRVQKCELELTRALAEKEQAKQILLKKIIARDEMSMAISGAYQRAEEERMDQMAACMKVWLAVEQEHIRFREKQLRQLEDHIVRMDRAGDIQLVIHNHRNPDNMHFQGKALSLLDWQLKQDVAGVKSVLKPVADANSDEMDALVAVHFESEPTEEKDLQVVESVTKLCDSADGRQCFVKALNRQRSLVTKVPTDGQFGSLVNCFHAFFDACVQHDDTKAAKTAMMLSATFYSTPDHCDEDHHRIERRYIQEEVKGHTIWSNPKFWEKALLLAVGEELHKSPQRCPWEDLPTNVPRSEGRFTREEAVSHVHNIVVRALALISCWDSSTSLANLDRLH